MEILLEEAVRENRWKPVENLYIYLIYFMRMMLSSLGMLDNAWIMLKTLEEFGSHLGLEISQAKSRFIFSPPLHPRLRCIISSLDILWGLLNW